MPESEVTESEIKQPSFSELTDYVKGLTETASAQGINLLQPMSDEEKKQVLDLIDSSDERLRGGLVDAIGLGLVDRIKDSIDNQAGDKKEGAEASELLDIYSSNKFESED